MFRINKILHLVIAACLLITSTTVIAQTWTSLNGPQIAKNVKDISISGDFVYIADSSSYLLKSTNGGTGWFVTGAPYSAPLFVLVKPDDATKVVTTKNVELRYSDDGGGSNGWQFKINDDNLIPLRLVAAVNNKNIMLLGRKDVPNITTDRSIWRSQLGGSDWNPVTDFTPTTDINDFSAIPTTSANWQPGTIWAAGSSNAAPSPSFSKTAIAEIRGLWISADYGMTWPNNKLGGVNVTSVALVPRSNFYDVYAAGSSSQNDTLYKLTDHPNNNWTAIFNGTAEIRMVRYNKNNNTIFLATNDGVYRSTNAATTNGGGTWTKMTGLTDLNVKTIAVSGTNTVFAGTSNSVYRSTDNGATWADVGKMNVTVDSKTKTSKTKK